MKYFAIYTNAEITEKPAWLDDFRNKYDLEYHVDTNAFSAPCNAHITLTQPRFINDCEAGKLRTKMTNFFSNYSKEINVEFSNLHLDRQDTTNNGCIMIDSIKNNILTKLQLDMLNFVNKNNNLCDITHKSYEDNFVPHLTVGRSLSKDRFDKAVSELPDKFRIKAIISEVILAVVPDESATERKNPKNLTVYKLSQH